MVLENVFLMNGGVNVEKIVKIDSKEIKIKSSAYTMFAYQNEFNRDMLEDVSKLQNVAKEIKKLDKNSEDYTLSVLHLIKPVLKVSMQLLFIMAKECNDSIVNYKEFLSGIDNLFNDLSWLNDTLLCALSPFTRQVQNS